MTATTRKTSDLFAGHPPTWIRNTHSVLDALKQAEQAASSVATVIAIPLPGAMVKLIARDLENQVVFYTECSGADAGEILGILGVKGPEQDITEMVQVFEHSGMDLLEAANAAALINSSSRTASPK